MADTPLAPVVRHLHKLAGLSPLSNVSDAQLLERFVQRRDEDAFAALVRRHGPMVWRVCRRVLRQRQYAEEAYQAVFLVLIRRAAKVRDPAALASFLYGVAYRIVRQARADLLRQSRQRESIAAPVADPADEAAWHELEQIVVEEVHALPEKYRTPILLCYWEGLTNEEAAVRLGWPAGTVKTRLLKARQRLHERLTRRGVSLSVGTVVTLLAAGSGDAAVPPIMAATAARLALDGTAGASAAVIALADQAIQSAALSKVKIALVLLLGSAITAGVGALAYHKPSARKPEEQKAKNREAEQPKAQAEQPKMRADRYGDPLPPGAIARLGSLRLYHGKHVDRVTLSPDGKFVVSTASGDNRLWDAITGRELPLRAELRRMDIFAAREKLLAVQRLKDGLQLWDVVAGEEIGRPLVVEEFVQSFCLSPDGKTLLIWGQQRDGRPIVRFCDAIQGKVGEPFNLKKGEGNQLTRFVFSADGKTLIMQFDNSTIHVWDVVSRTEKRVSRPGPAEYGGFIALSTDGTILATAPSAGKRIRLWDTRTLKELPPLLNQPDANVESITFSPDGQTLAAASTKPSDSPIVRLWNLGTRQQTRQYKGKSYQVFYITFSADGKTLAAADGCEVTLWDVATGKFCHDFGHTYCVDSLAFSPDGKRLVSGAAYTDNIVRIWNPRTGEKTAQLRGHVEGIEVVAYGPDGKLIASGSQDGTVRLWDATTGREVRRLEAKDGMIYAMAFAPDGRTIASGGRRKAVHLWDAATGRELRSYDNPSNWILRLAFSSDGKMLATRGFEEKDIRLWDAADGKEIRRLPGRAAGCPSLEFSPDGQTLAAGSDDGAVRCWNALTGEECRTFALNLQPGEVNRVLSIAFSPDGRSMAVGYNDGTIRLGEMSSGKERACYVRHEGGVTCVAFSPDGTLLASGSPSRTALVWDVTGQRTTNPPRNRRLTVEEGNGLWSDMADSDASKAYRAMRTLFAAGEQAVSFLKGRLRRAAAIDERRIDRLIADLDCEEFVVRQKARKELRALGDVTESALQKVLTGKPSVEQRLRVKELLQEINRARSPESLRELRAVEVLEHIGTSDAREVLKTLADGASAASLTREAKASLQRLARRENPTPRR
ncbi:MAG TPA: sigma-70 family RNA polymerase sigma factor [Gemmataceae bacterium]